MADEKKNSPGDIGVKPGDSGENSPEKTVFIPTKIGSVSEAKKLVQERYQKPKGDKTTFVTTDCNVFYQDAEKYARAHARKRNLEIFEVTWD
jgi:hypothetical protein